MNVCCNLYDFKLFISLQMQQYMRSANTVSRVLINRFKKIKTCKPVSLVIGIIPDKNVHINILHIQELF